MDFLRNIFITPDEPRLRSGWRLLCQFLIMFFVIALLAPLMFGLAQASPALAFLGDQFLIGVIAYSLSVYVARRWFDRRSFVSLGIQPSSNSVRDLVAGVIIAGLIMGLIVLVELSLGWLDFRGFAALDAPTLMGLGYWAFAFILVGWGEELLSRGYMLQNLEEGVGLKWAVFISSAIFGLLHAFNPDANIAAILGILGAGYFLAYGYIRTRQLWLPIGLHIGWNFFEGPIFSFPVSGIETVKLLNHEVTGPVLVTGGAFGPEAGLIVLPAMAIGAYLIYVYTKRFRKKEITPST
jgi:membrane protease YdiL (CAAX protease family)